MPARVRLALSSTTSVCWRRSLQYTGQMKRAETLLKRFALPTNLLVQAYNKREWPMFLRARGRYAEAEAAAKTLIADPHPVVQATGHIEAGLRRCSRATAGAMRRTPPNTALKLLRTAPGGGIAADALLALQGEFNLRTAERDKGRATLEEAAQSHARGAGPDAWAQALFSLDAIARAARDRWRLGARRANGAADDRARPVVRRLALRARRSRPSTTTTRRQRRRSSRWRPSYWAKADPDLPELAEARRKSK